MGSTENQEAFQKEECFEPRKYLDAYFMLDGTNPWNLIKMLIEKCLPKQYALVPSGQRLLEVGGGPTIYAVAMGSVRFDEIYLSDFSKHNLKEIKLWLDNDPRAFDWSKMLELTASKMPNGYSGDVIAGYLRKKIRDVIQCDVNQSDIIDKSIGQFDVVISNFCLDSACEGDDSFHTAFGNLCHVIKSGGHLIMNLTMGGTYYFVNGHRFDSYVITESIVKSAIAKVGLEVLLFETHNFEKKDIEKAKISISDIQGVMSVVCKKN